jgi:hypothetical protein
MSRTKAVEGSSRHGWSNEVRRDADEKEKAEEEEEAGPDVRYPETPFEAV